MCAQYSFYKYDAKIEVLPLTDSFFSTNGGDKWVNMWQGAKLIKRWIYE